MNWIDCRVSMPEINETALIYRKDIKEYLVSVYLGNSQFHYADCCQGIQKTCTASHWMPLPRQPIEGQ
ncbi:DUF551 domain-containing protein [Serratia symbiotica]|uniref:DUF551 domain-containing protein n=1 Tax=Serratia symbiotica TaxID=138074 RepID=UPI001DC30B2D|nr:DUF551 domain-containing protein [Serratia symbiotica]NIG87331.1 DUF551 domain-containing protein [Serratia symbiotica]